MGGQDSEFQVKPRSAQLASADAVVFGWVLAQKPQSS